MKKVKFIFSILVSFIMLIGISSKSYALNVSTSETPLSVDSESEFTITIKLDEKVNSFFAYISYDPELVVMSGESDDKNLNISPEVKKKGNLAMAYKPEDGKTSTDTFKIKVKAKECTTEKIAKFEIYNIEYTSSNQAEALKNVNMNITIKPTKKEDTPVIEDKKEEPNNQYADKELAKAGESSVILFIIGALIISAVILKRKSERIK